MKWRFGLLAAAMVLAVMAQTQMNVAQLADFVRSELALRMHTDKQIAAGVKKLTLSEKLTDKTITDLEAQGAGPKTLEALRALRDHTASLKQTTPANATSSPATEVDSTPSGPPSASLGVKTPAPPPPDSVHQQQILDAMRQYALTYTQSLPNYICVRVDRRYVDPQGSDSYRSLGTMLAKVSYNAGREEQKVYSDRGKFVDSEIGGLASGGATSSGEFAIAMKSLFEPKSQAEFNWDHWAKIRGRVMAVFNYFVDSGHSDYTLGFGEGTDEQRIVTAYKGLVYADANTGEIDRITFNAIDVPASFPIRSTHELIDYDMVDIGGQQAVLPIHALLHMRGMQQTFKNEIEFRNYRKFGSDVKIIYDMDANAPAPAPLPESKTSEQPLNSNSTPATEQPPAKNEGTPAKSAPANSSSPWTLPTPPPPPPQ